MSAYRTPAPRNEPVLNYAPGSPERAAHKAALAKMSGETIEIPVVIGGQEFRTGRTSSVVAPHDHRRVLAKAHLADPRAHREGVGNQRRNPPAHDPE